MANVTINNTTKAGWFSLYLNDLAEPDEDYEHHCPIGGVQGICLVTLNGNNGLELHMVHEEKPFFLSFDASSDNFMQVDSVNGDTPSSLTDLRDKILSLLNYGLNSITSDSVSCASTTTALVAANDLRRGLVITNTGSNAVFIGIDEAAVLNKGIYLSASGGTWVMDAMTFTKGAINGITVTSTSNISIQEFE